ncbi:MAG: hypothetical protein Q8P56_03545, partial [Candidatus Uhrbacteria bacterium]|nr:hypothetical protein [Candidatus Uhrbacteria bacterium]
MSHDLFEEKLRPRELSQDEAEQRMRTRIQAHVERGEYPRLAVLGLMVKDGVPVLIKRAQPPLEGTYSLFGGKVYDDYFPQSPMEYQALIHGRLIPAQWKAFYRELADELFPQLELHRMGYQAIDSMIEPTYTGTVYDAQNNFNCFIFSAKMPDEEVRPDSREISDIRP